jgi:hypothetical protein
MATSPGRRTHIDPADFHPRVSRFFLWPLWEPDDELGRFSLLTEEAVKDQRRGQAARLMPSDSQNPRNHSAQTHRPKASSTNI